MTQKKFGMLFRVVALFGAMLTTSPSSAAMSMAGSFQVDASGAGNYTIPLTVPPGVSGVQPSLTLIYNSQGGSGDLGVGWSLGGLSEITRCPRTPTQDSVSYPGTIGFDGNDRFCLDGQRLIIKSGTYGASGAEYRTEHDTFSKIISYGTAGTGPQYFKVWTKAGEIVEYGNTADSRIEAVGLTTIRAWAMNKLNDNTGNYLTISYTKDTTNGAYIPNEIKYAGNNVTAQLPNASVKFVYESRTDPVARYMGGKLVKQIQRLSKVQTYVATTKVREYTLTYEVSPVTYRSRVTQIQECVNSTCLPKTLLTWQTQTEKTAFDSTSNTSGSITWGRFYRTWSMDANGDGIADIVSGGAVAETGGENIFHILHGDRPNEDWTVPTLPWGDSSTSSNRDAVVADFNGDGLTDIASPNLGNVYMRLAAPDGSGFSVANWPVVNQWGANDMSRVGDFNGDGLADIASPSGSDVYMKLSTGTGFDSQDWAASNQWGTAGKTFVGDFNGDGLTDFATASGGNIYMKLSTGTGFTSETWTVSNLWGNDAVTWAADFNGDGLMDIASASGGNIYMKLSTGKSFVSETWAVPNAWGTDAFTYVGDFNGDGLPDIASVSGANVYMKFSTGTSFIPKTWTATNSWGEPQYYTKVNDFNGDGLADIVSGVFISGGTGKTTYYKFTKPGLDLIARFDNGVGLATDVEYDVLSGRPTADTPTYKMDARTSNPVIEVIGPLYVVKTVSASNGIGGILKTAHKYWGLKSDRGLNSRGSKGFREMGVTQIETGSQTLTFYNQTWPYTGLPKQVIKYGYTGSASPKLNQVDYTYVCKYPATATNCAAQPQPGSLYFVYQSQSVEQIWDLNGVVMPTVTTTSAYDMCANPTSATTGTADGYSKNLVNVYSGVDPANCYLGRLSSSSVTTTSP